MGEAAHSQDHSYRKRLWDPTSWVNHPVAQSIIYSDQEHFDDVCSRIRKLPDLTCIDDADRLQDLLTEAAAGKCFVIQGGDCAEAFADIRPDTVNLKTNLLLEQASLLSDGLGCPTVCIGRIAGQYAKPRSVNQETLSCGSVVNPFRGDNINGSGKQDQSPNPERLLLGHHYAAATLSIIGLEAYAGPLTKRLGHTFFTSHEALHLHLEAASTRREYNTSAHMVWIGERTRQVDGAHVEYVRGLKNHIGVKVGPTTSSAELVQLLSIIDPGKRLGRVSLIARLGAANVSSKLPILVQAVREAGFSPVWLCDPCHGNTFVTTENVKTRFVETMLMELKETHWFHKQSGSRLCGLHLEQTGEDVTECLDSVDTVGGHDFSRYRSQCDPRLSRLQALNLVREYIDYVGGLTS